MTINYTPLLSLAEPVTGTQSGTWGDDVNQGLTDYLDIAIAGAQVISGSQTAVTLSKTTGSAAATNIAQVGSAGVTGTAQYAVINCTGNPASMLTITAPATSKTYVVINSTSTSQPVKLVGAGPTTGVTVSAARAALIAWNGSDFVLIATNDASKISGILAVANGGTGLSSGTSGGIPYFSGTSAMTSSAALAANALVIGGGAGSAPSTITTGTGVVTALGVNTGTAGSFLVDGNTITNPQVISVNSASNALRITQIGTGNAILVEDSANPDSTPVAVDQHGNILLGKTTRQTNTTGAFEAHTTSQLGGLLPSIGNYNWSTSTSAASWLSFFHYPSGTIGTTTTANTSGDTLGVVGFWTQNGAGLHYSGTITGTTASDLITVNLNYVGNTHIFTGAVTTTSASGVLTRAAATQDGVALVGRAGGTSSYEVTITPTTLTADRTLTLPDATTTVVGTDATQTLTNKRINPRVSSTTSTSTITPDVGSFDQYAVTALAVTLTFFAPTGTPVDGTKLIFRILDNGTTQSLLWNSTYTGIGVNLPTATTSNKTTYVGCIYNAHNARWDVVSVTTQA